jgi:hypothetical protein
MVNAYHGLSTGPNSRDSRQARRELAEPPVAIEKLVEKLMDQPKRIVR